MAKAATKPTQAPATATAPATAPATATAPVLGKYNRLYTATGTAPIGVPPTPGNVAMLATRYVAGKYAPAKPSTVMGLVHGWVVANPGCTGATLVAAMQGPLAAALARTNAVRYAANGAPCGAWCAGYVRGAAGKKHQHIAPGPAPKAGA